MKPIDLLQDWVIQPAFFFGPAIILAVVFRRAHSSQQNAFSVLNVWLIVIIALSIRGIVMSSGKTDNATLVAHIAISVSPALLIGPLLHNCRPSAVPMWLLILVVILVPLVSAVGMAFLLVATGQMGLL